MCRPRDDHNDLEVSVNVSTAQLMAPVHVKIDRVFIADLDRDDASRLIVGAVAGLEHDRRMALVTQRSCARPMGADEIDVLLDRDAEPGVDSSGTPAVNRSVHA